MKKKQFVLVLFILLFTSFSQAQTYRSYFGEEFTKWYIYMGVIDASGSSIYEISDNKDVIINDKKYRKISDVNVYLREETEIGKLYILKDGYGDEEYLVSDMSLKLGDKFYMHFPAWEKPEWFQGGYAGLEEDENGYYTIVDSVYYEEDEYARKHIRTQLINYDNMRCTWCYDGKDNPMEFIEGIGSNYGFYYFLIPLNGIFYSHDLTCYETEAGLWKNNMFFDVRDTPTVYRECFLEQSIKSVEQELPIEIRQTQGKLNISFGFPVTGEVILYNSLGKKQVQQNLLSEKTVVFSLNGLSQGIYLLYVSDRNTGKKNVKKIVFK
jgi:hypothetical protein